ncbi:MAG: matrixin family metalloprotease [bacterium]|nr:matrixin family metalloprotease [bacterium]
MIIRLWLYGTLIVLVLFFTGHSYIENIINISGAESCYRSKNYVCAFKAYRKAFATDMDDSKYIGHYVATLSQMKKIAVVQEELNNLLVKYPDNSYTSDIEAIFEKIKEDVDAKYPDTYINDVVQGVNVVHWNTKERNTLIVFIDESNTSSFPGYYIDEVKNAFKDYSAALNNMIKFEYTNTSSQADINISFVRQISGGQCNNSDCSNVMGLTENTTVGSQLSKAVIRFRYQDSDNTDFTKNQIYNIAKHEIGHALGVSGHSYHPEDIMYPVSNDAKFSIDAQVLKITRKEFSQRDIDTFKLLYNIVPDITDKSYDVTKYPDMYFPIAAIGTKKQIGEKNLEESQRYADMVDTNYISQMNLAEGYFASKNFDKAQEAFSDALILANSNEEKFAVYNNLAVVFYEKKDYEAAIEYADMANSYSKDELANEIKAYCYIELNRYKEAQKLLERLCKLYPQNPTYSGALVGVYFKQYKTISALKELKRIKKENPAAIQEPIFKPYGMLLKFL